MTTEKELANPTDKIVVHGMFESGNYVTTNRYTQDQQEEIRFLLQESARAAARVINPEMADKFDVDITD